MKTTTGYQRLDDAISGLTRVFKQYHGSPHWNDSLGGGDSSATVTHSVWELTDDEYRDFCWHSVCLGGPINSKLLAVRYFLPRVALDISLSNRVTNREPWCSSQSAGLLDFHDWRNWPEPEVRAIETWYGAWIQHTASRGDWMYCSLATRSAGVCGFDFNKFFHAWREWERGMSIQWLVHTIDEHWASLLQTGWPKRWREYWGEQSPPPSFAVKFIILLLRKSSRGLLENAFFHEDTVIDPSLLSTAIHQADQCIQFGHVKKDTPLGTALASEEMAL